MLLSLLKDQTREQHAQLEAMLPLPESAASHVAQLKAYFGFVEPWERALAAVLAEADPIRAGRGKTAWLVDDLDFWGVDSEQREQLPRTTRLPSLASRPEILGAAYVLEGSTLGGRFIAQHLEEQLGFRDDRGYRYFRSYGPQVGAQWQAFRAELSRASSPAHDPLMVRSARETFGLLHRWFSSQLAHGRIPSHATGAPGP